MKRRVAASGFAALALCGCAVIAGIDTSYAPETPSAPDAGDAGSTDAPGDAASAPDVTSDALGDAPSDAAPYHFACGAFPTRDQWCPSDRGAGLCADFDTTAPPPPFTRVIVTGAGTIGATKDGNPPSPPNVLRATANGSSDSAYLQLDGVNATLSRARLRFFLRVDQAGATGSSEVAQLEFDSSPTQLLTLLVQDNRLVYLETLGTTEPYGISAVGDLATCGWHEIDWLVDFASHQVTVLLDGATASAIAWSGAKGPHFAVELGITDVTAGAWSFSYDDLLFAYQ